MPESASLVVPHLSDADRRAVERISTPQDNGTADAIAPARHWSWQGMFRTGPRPHAA